MSSGDAGQAKAAIMLYQQRGDRDGALTLLQKNGWDRSASIALLRTSDLTAARATALLTLVLFVSGSAAWVLWPDTWWLLVALLAWAVERTFRTAKLLRRARAMQQLTG